ncbi:MAG: hypothetical protein SH821_13875 [Phototrophicales bacterium]|nr:hypothetical protein [Phototrophicales bacterium]
MATKKAPKQLYVVLKEDTKRLLRMAGAKIQFETGESVSDNDALYDLFKTYRPDLIEELEAQKKREKVLNRETQA